MSILLTTLAATAAAPAAPTVQLDTVTLNGRAEAPTLALERINETTLARDTEAQDPAQALARTLSRIPGLYAANRGNDAQDLQLSSRGYGARASFGVRGLRLVVDGIPASTPDGQGQVGSWLLADAASLEVLRGPFSALYGSASGGVIALQSRWPIEERMQAGVTLGSFGLRQATVGLDSLPADGQALSVTGQVTHRDGWRPHSGSDRRLALARWQLHMPGQQFMAVLQLQSQPADDPLGLTAEQFAADPRQTAPQAEAFDTRKTAEQQQLGLRWQRELSAQARVQVAGWWGHRAVDQWQAIPLAVQNAPTHPGGVIALRRRFGGLDMRLNWAFAAEQELTLGWNVETQHDDRRGYLNQAGNTGTLKRDETNRARSSEPYAQWRWTPTPEWELLAGLRASRLHFDSEDRYLANGDDSGGRRFNGVQPVAGVAWRPVPGHVVRLAAGRASETPTLTELAYRAQGTGFNADLRQQRSKQVELGWELREGERRVALTAFHAATRDEISVLANSGGRTVYTNATRTRRTGLEAAAQLPLARGWQLDMAATRLMTRVQPGGQPLPGVPASFGSAELRWQGQGLDAALSLQGRARLPADDAGAAAAAGNGLWGLSVGGALGPEWRWRLRADNLLNRITAASVIVNEANKRYFEPAAPRSAFVSLTWQPR
ncbi:TonB-dependent receptor family protein [Roseateles cellulosilyticus]|uniref:TonB-dependent receptor n=1 Tax=Pelomonas cellulosilytica TaxID=2906762 RepID=A0ABS8Y4K5_9BURK|nr:TonB-dependent receptor [Pelomonas sp. P8]MCE4558096.1 TonB-dependent receptor [Pelomonas sp. P8]